MVEVTEMEEALVLFLGGLVMLLVILSVAFYALTISRKRVLRVERERAEYEISKKSQLLRSSIDGAEAERKKIAEELHDQINAQLTVARMAMAGAEKTESVVGALESLDQTIQDIRSISRELMPPVLERFGLLDALDSLFDGVESKAKIHIEFDAPEDWDTSNLKRDLALYRIVQEFIQNTLKYAQASEIQVTVERTEDTIRLLLKDDGVGMDLNRREAGLGTRNISSRVDYLSGTLFWRSAPSEGVTLDIEIPNKREVG